MLNLAMGAALAVFALNSPLQAHFLWRIDSDKPSYLFGTVHSSDPAVRTLPAEVIEALRRSDSFHPELELSPENIGRMTGAIFAPRSTDLREELSPELWERLAGNARKMGLPDSLLRRIPVQLTPLLFATNPETDFSQIVDVQVYELAKESGLAVHPLETVEEQVGVFQALTREQAVALLEEALEEFERGFPAQKQILRLYAAGDLEALTAFVDEEFSRLQLPELTESLIARRNETMVNRLVPHLKSGAAFVAVGVAHMPGDAGMIALLEQRGYRVTRVPLKETRSLP